ncbi:MAG: DnaD domain protein [Caldilineaceae bacterium]|nr:DnaD domain protein [Caldilineaceae bacterium]
MNSGKRSAGPADAFVGFPAGGLEEVPIPARLLTDLLSRIDSLAETRLTLYCYQQIGRLSGPAAWLRARDLRSDPVLLDLMSGLSELHSPQEVLEDALEKALVRNALLGLELPGADGEPADKALFLNTDEGRRLRTSMQAAGAKVRSDGRIPVVAQLSESEPFRIYHQNFGLLTPVLADQLRNLIEDFPLPWVCEAMEIAVARNKKALAYVKAILNRWEQEARESGKANGFPRPREPMEPHHDHPEWTSRPRGRWE